MSKRKQVPGMTLERAMVHLRRGKMIRRRAWHPGAKLARMGDKVYLIAPATSGHNAPLVWRPYAECILAGDWEVTK